MESTKALRQKSFDTIVLHRGEYITSKISSNQKGKRNIAKHAVENYVKDYDAVFLDASSTIEIVAEEMFRQRRYLSVLTNNMGVYPAYIQAGTSNNRDVSYSNPGNKLLITGGEYNDVHESLLGRDALNSISKFNPNVIIIGTSGLMVNDGIFCHGYEESSIKSLLWTMPTDIRLIVTDWTKFGKRDAHSFGEIRDFRLNTNNAIIITNQPPRELYGRTDAVKVFEMEIELIQRMGIVVDVCSEEDE